MPSKMKQHKGQGAFGKEAITTVTKGAIQRLGHKVGVSEMSALVYEEIRVLVKEALEAILEKANVYMTHCHRRRLSADDVNEAVTNITGHIAFLRRVLRDMNEKKLERCEVYAKPKTSSSSVEKHNETYANYSEDDDYTEDYSDYDAFETEEEFSDFSEVEDIKKRKKSRKVSQRSKVLYYRKQNDCVQMSISGFARLVREIGHNINSQMTFEGDAIGLLHILTENYISEVIANGWKVASLSAKRRTLMPSDIQLAISIASSA